MAETTLMEAKAGGWDLTRAQGWKQPLTLSVEDAVQQANREHGAARQGWSVADQREMSEQARARAHTERTSRYGEEPDYGKH